MSVQGRQKRMRTSFKHHQLRIMKSYFQLNHNPDAKDLKQLAQKTGLSKRVLQVWDAAVTSPFVLNTPLQLHESFELHLTCSLHCLHRFGSRMPELSIAGISWSRTQTTRTNCLQERATITTITTPCLMKTQLKLTLWQNCPMPLLQPSLTTAHHIPYPKQDPEQDTWNMSSPCRIIMSLQLTLTCIWIMGVTHAAQRHQGWLNSSDQASMLWISCSYRLGNAVIWISP